MVRNSYNIRRLFGATLLASAVLALSSARALPISPEMTLSRESTVITSYELRHPSKRDSIVTVAWALLGTPYELGGTTLQRGFDCSGLVRFVLSKVHLTLPRTANQQALVGAPIDRDRLLPGDLLTFGEGTRVSHVGIYIGDGKYVHASSIAGRVILSPLDRPPSRLIRPLRGGRRLLAIVIADSVQPRKWQLVTR